MGRSLLVLKGKLYSVSTTMYTPQDDWGTQVTPKVCDEDLCSRLQKCKDQGDSTILDIDGNYYMGTVNLGGRLKG